MRSAVVHLESKAIDDALEPLDLLMATEEDPREVSSPAVGADGPDTRAGRHRFRARRRIRRATESRQRQRGGVD